MAAEQAMEALPLDAGVVGRAGDVPAELFLKGDQVVARGAIQRGDRPRDRSADVQADRRGGR